MMVLMISKMLLFSQLWCGLIWSVLFLGRPSFAKDFDTRPSARIPRGAQNADAQCPQTDSDGSAGQCPCLRDERGKYMCVAYDPTYQATSVEEAAMNFHDTTEADAKKAKTLIPATKCGARDLKCKECTKYVYGQLLKETRAFNDYSLLNETLHGIADSLGFRGGRRGNSYNPFQAALGAFRGNMCPELKAFDRKKVDVYNLWNLPDIDITGCIAEAANQLLGASSKFSLDNLGQGGTGTDDFNKFMNIFNAGSFSRQRQKREETIKDIDHLYVIKCDNRGQPVDADSGFINLCNICWKWGVLRSGLYPKYINLMTCDSDNKCLSGWGSCQQRYRSYQVLEKTASGYKPYSINIPIACDCQVKAGSALHKFVAI